MSEFSQSVELVQLSYIFKIFLDLFKFFKCFLNFRSLSKFFALMEENKKAAETESGRQKDWKKVRMEGSKKTAETERGRQPCIKKSNKSDHQFKTRL
jgi:hypothetical protein